MSMLMMIESRIADRRQTLLRAEAERRTADRRREDRERAEVAADSARLAARRAARLAVRVEAARAAMLDEAVTAWRNRVGEIRRGL